MKFRITKTCRAAGRHCEPGDIIELEEDQAKSLLAAGRGVPKDQKKAKDGKAGFFEQPSTADENKKDVKVKE